MWHAVIFFIALILLLIGLWLYSMSIQALTVDVVAASQKRNWAFVALIVGFFLLLLVAGCEGQLKTWRC